MSDTGRPVLTLSAVAAEALAAYRFITVGGGYPAAAGDAVAGVTRHHAAAAERVSYTVLGTATVEAGGAIPAGNAIKSSAAGKAIDHDNGEKVGVAIEAAAADGDLIECLVLSKGA